MINNKATIKKLDNWNYHLEYSPWEWFRDKWGEANDKEILKKAFEDTFYHIILLKNEWLTTEEIEKRLSSWIWPDKPYIERWKDL